jgi:O-antigen ligase
MENWPAERSMLPEKKRADRFADLWNWPAYSLFFLMLVFPMVLSLLYLKAVLFALLLMFVLVRACMSLRLDLHPTVVIWTLALACVSLFFGLRGLFLGAPGATKCIQVYVLWPLVYLVLLGGIGRLRTLHGLEKTLVFSTLFIALFGIYYLLSQLNVLPPIPYSESLTSTDALSSGLFSEHVELAFPGLNSLPFLVPFVMASLVIRSRQPDENSTSSLWLWVTLLTCLTIVLLSGRRALQSVTILAPLLVLILGSFQPQREKSHLRKSLVRMTSVLALGLVLFTALILPFKIISIEGIVERFSSAFDFSPTTFDDSPAARSQQFDALLRGWYEDPLIGAGLGASAHGSIRSEIMPWAYELYYVDVLFQTGLLGFVAYTAGTVWIYWSGIRIIRRGGASSRLMVPALAGLSGLLIATATNPYLARFDGIWAIFLPLAIINYWLLLHEQAQSASNSKPAFTNP